MDIESGFEDWHRTDCTRISLTNSIESDLEVATYPMYVRSRRCGLLPLFYQIRSSDPGRCGKCLQASEHAAEDFDAKLPLVPLETYLQQASVPLSGLFPVLEPWPAAVSSHLAGSTQHVCRRSTHRRAVLQSSHSHPVHEDACSTGIPCSQ